MSKPLFSFFHLVSIFWVVLLTPPSAFSLEHWYVPIENQSSSVIIENPQTQSENIWISGPIELTSEGPYEYLFQVPPKGELEISQDLVSKFPWIHLKSNSEKLKVKITQSFIQSYIQKNGSNSYLGSLLNQSLVLLNLSGINQSLNIKSTSENFSITLNSFEKKEITVENGFVEITASMPIKVFAKAKNQLINLDIGRKPISLNTPDGIYFLMADNLHSQSFVVRLEDSQQIEQARAQIKDPAGLLPRILSARVTYKPQNHNRNFASQNKTTWSWHIEQVYTFADFGSTACNGSPEMIEELLLPFIENSGIICFWNFHVVKELTPAEISSP